MRCFPGENAVSATRGFTVLEVSLALTILLGAALLLTQFLVASSRQHNLADQRRLALEELSNRLERMQSARWDDVNVAAIEAQEFSPETKAKLTGVKLKASIAEEPDPAGGRRVQLTITWEESRGLASLELTGWKYPPTEVQP